MALLAQQLLAQNYMMAYVLVGLFMFLAVLGVSLPRFRRTKLPEE